MNSSERMFQIMEDAFVEPKKYLKLTNDVVLLEGIKRISKVDQSNKIIIKYADKTEAISYKEKEMFDKDFDLLSEALK